MSLKKFNTYKSSILSKIIENINWKLKRRLHKFDEKLNFPFNENKLALEDLTPQIIDDKLYVESLFWALRNKEINNIALTGTYGSGKSSILKTLQNNYKQFYYLNISLATFEDTNLNENEREELNNKIELSILQQILYSEKSKNLPNSRFKRIRNIKYHLLFFKSIIWFIVFICFVYLFKKNYFEKITFLKDPITQYGDILEIIASIFLVVGTFSIFRNFIKATYNLKFDKINSKGEVELNREIEDNSILNKNLDEIIYFFEKTRYNVVVIEDLDRFKEPEIFTKLREINLLINNSKQINRHITFIYALKDDMFKDGNRTKFFDFILPVIPVINTSNSFSKLKNRLKGEKEIKDEFIYDLSLYIDDMRLLINIVNEYKIYKEKLATNLQLNENKLLGFIVYKNKFPDDFSNLSKNTGLIFKVFNNDLEKIKSNLIEEINIKISKNNKKIEEIKKIGNINIQDLRKLYILKIIEKLPNEKDVKLNLNQDIDVKNISLLLSDEIFEEIVDSDIIKYSYNVYNRSYSRYDTYSDEIDFSLIQKEIDNTKKYQEKENLIIERDTSATIAYNEEINEFKIEKDKIKNKLLKDLLFNDNSTQHLSEAVRVNNILTYLLRNGYIAEDYFDYISIFYEGDITRNDKNFILSIRDKKPLQHTYKLDKVEGIIKHIIKDFDNVEILNINLLDYLFEKQEILFIQQFFAHYKNSINRPITFIESYLQQGKYQSLFIKNICNNWEGFWDYIENQSSYTTDFKNEILIDIIKSAELKDIKSQNIDNILTEYISDNKNFLIHFDDNDLKVQNVLVKLEVKFQNPIIYGNNKKLFNFIYANNLYDLNHQMITQFLKETIHINNTDIPKLQTSNLTIIKTYDCPQLQEYISKRINYYVQNVFLLLDSNTKEDEKTVLYLLNHEDLKEENKIEVIKKQDIKLSQLKDVVDVSLWIDILENNKVQPTWQNIYFYYQQYGLDDFVINHLNSIQNTQDLSLNKIFSTISGEDKDKHLFIKKLILENKILDSVYIYICKSIEHSYNHLDFTKINEFKIIKLIENSIIEFNALNFEALREETENCHILFIELNFESYISIKEEIILDVIDYIDLLESSKLSEENKISILNEIDKDLIDNENILANTISKLLVSLKKIAIDPELLYEVLLFSSDVNAKLILLNKYFDIYSIDTDSIKSLISTLGLPYSNINEKWKEIKIENNKNNLDFVNKLTQVKYSNISSVDISNAIIKINTKRK